MMRPNVDDRDNVSVYTGLNERGRAFGAARLVALAVVALACLTGLWLLIQTFDPQARAARDAALYQQQQLDAQIEGVKVFSATLLTLALPLALVVGMLGLVVVGLLLFYRRWAAPVAIAAHYHVKALEAQRQAVPQTLTYSPHYAYRNDVQGLGTTEDVSLALPSASTPTFAELLAQGNVGKGNPLLLGTDIETGEQLTGSWLDLYSTAIGGLPGTGKTTSQRFLACQTALHGASFVIVDPHAGAGEDSLAETLAPLASAFICEPASDDRGILQAVRLVADIGRKRVQGERDRKPLVLWIDETTALLSRSSVAGPLAELMEQIAQEYRKVGVYCAASGQIWTASRTGDDSALRDSFASVWAHRMKRSQARLLLPTGEAERVERLEKGQALIWRTSGATNVLQVPNTTAADVIKVATLLASPRLPGSPARSQNQAYGMPVDMPEGSHRVARADLATGASGRHPTVSAEAARAAALFLAGSDPAAIVAELRGVKSNEGKRYQMALHEVLGLIREGVRR